MDRATGIAHPIFGNVKYHGELDWELRVPFHASISSAIEKLYTKTTVIRGSSGGEDQLYFKIGDNYEKKPLEQQKGMLYIIKAFKELAGVNDAITIITYNGSRMNGDVPVTYDLTKGQVAAKGVGFSSSAGASQAEALAKVFNLDYLLKDKKRLSRYARIFSSSAARSLVGGFAKLNAPDADLTRSYENAIKEGNADKIKEIKTKVDESSYAELLAEPKDFPHYSMLIYPIESDARTDMAHREAVNSPFFQTRVYVLNSHRLKIMMDAIERRDVTEIAYNSERDAYDLHAVTMTGPECMQLDRPLSVAIKKGVHRLRNGAMEPKEVISKNGLLVYAHQDTGPSVNVTMDNTIVNPNNVHQKLKRLTMELENISLDKEPIISGLGGGADLSDNHLPLPN